MSHWPQYHSSTDIVTNPIYTQSFNINNVALGPPNRFIYVKQNFDAIPPPMPNKVLVNPHFKKKVYVNPQFNLQQNPLSAQPPKIHVNPNVLKRLQATKQSQPESKPIVEEKKTTVISTHNKLLRVPVSSVTSSNLIQTKIVRKRHNSIHTKYKIIRSSNANTSLPTTVIRNKFKLDKRTKAKSSDTMKTANAIGKPISKKRYIYIDRFLSISVMAKSVLLKQNSNLGKPGFVNINGILYKKSPNSLKKATDSIKKEQPSTSRYKIDRKKVWKTNVKQDEGRNKSLVKRFKVIRAKKQSKVTSSNKLLRKCNISCQVYRKFGKCKGKENGTCIKVHNPDQIVLCTRFLQGACLDQKCLLSHKVSHAKMPTCKYFLEGLCSRDDCPYLHVKISPKADICKDFLEGFCKEGSQCDKRHQFLCPDFEKKQSCPRRRCPYPHGNLVRKRKVSNSVAKKNSLRRNIKKPRTCQVVTGEGNQNSEVANRYYGGSDQDKKSENRLIETVTKLNRPKLGTLPSFIPFESI